MKKNWIFLLFGFVLLLSACGTETIQTVEFEDFSFELQTKELVYEKNLGSIVQQNNLGEILLTAFVAEENVLEEEDELVMPYLNSFLASKLMVDESVSLESFVDTNINKVSLLASNYSESKLGNKNFYCGSQELTGILQEFDLSVVDEESLYFAQYFFIYEEELYTLSFSSEDDRQVKAFVDSLDSLVCD